MIKREQSFTTWLQKWMAQNWAKTGLYEVKVVKGGTFALSQIRESQKLGLTLANSRQLIYKISDMDIGAKPADFFILSGELACVIVLFIKSGLFYGVLYNDLIVRGKKSYKEQEIAEISLFKGKYKKPVSLYFSSK